MLTCRRLASVGSRYMLAIMRGRRSLWKYRKLVSQVLRMSQVKLESATTRRTRVLSLSPSFSLNSGEPTTISTRIYRAAKMRWLVYAFGYDLSFR